MELDQPEPHRPHDDNVFADVWDVDPMLGAAYIQDRLDYGDLVIDLGLPGTTGIRTVFPALPGLVDCSITTLGPTQCRGRGPEATTKDEIAPRLGVAHPITDDTQVRLSYGKFYQLPQLQHFFSSYLTDIQAWAATTTSSTGTRTSTSSRRRRSRRASRT